MAAVLEKVTGTDIYTLLSEDPGLRGCEGLGLGVRGPALLDPRFVQRRPDAKRALEPLRVSLKLFSDTEEGCGGSQANRFKNRSERSKAPSSARTT